MDVARGDNSFTLPGMTLKEAMASLEQAGTAQNRKIYQRHGARPPLFGVSFAHQNQLRKRIKIDHELALGLWSTGNVDARILAAMIADPERLTVQQANAWAKDANWSALSSQFADLVGRSPIGKGRMEQWIQSKNEWIAATGWSVCSVLASGKNGLSSDDFLPCLRKIEEEIHQSPNAVRDALNWALIAIGVRSPELKSPAIAAARRIGPVEVDHGETSCKTPDAEAYILKTLDHRKKKQAKAKQKLQ